MWGNSIIITRHSHMGEESTHGRMEVRIRGNGNTDKWREVEPLNARMGTYMRGNGFMEKCMGKEEWNIRIGTYMMGLG